VTTADIGINDQLIKLRSTHSWTRRVWSLRVSYFVVCYFRRETCNTTKLLNHVALCRIDNETVSNLILIIAV